MAPADDDRAPARDRRRKRPGDEDEEASQARVVARAPLPRWLKMLINFSALVLLIATTAFAGGWMGVRSVESEINYGPQEVEEEDERASLPPLTLVRGLDIAMERPLQRGGASDRFLRGFVAWVPGGRVTESAVLAPLEPDQAKEVESPMVPRGLADTRVDRPPAVVSASLERAGRLGATEPLNVPRARAGVAAGGETVPRAPGNPAVRVPGERPVDGGASSTISPPSVYNDATGVPGRRSPLPHAVEHALPSLLPPADASPLEAVDDSGWRQRGLVP